MQPTELEDCQHGYIKASCSQCKLNKKEYDSLIDTGKPLPWAWRNGFAPT